MRFFCDSMLGRLSVYLRILGIDAEYSNSKLFDVKVEEARRSDRIFLTRDTRILRLKWMIKYYFVESNFPEFQVIDVLRAFEIQRDMLKPFLRCLRCNTELRGISKEEIRDRVPDYVYQVQSSFSYCDGCDSVYWRGSHYERMRRWVEKVITVLPTT
ncbi:MAG: Mut7-C RNAse domain-containing protein [Deltaproteobacteria bacterium]|nr:Mut7-C RNAse domain-containing protein [Deltaproteobacteria bacterium]